jgi:pyruvate formate lyase activating enzyme
MQTSHQEPPTHAHAAESGVIFNIQRYSIDDGPGIRTTVFLKGCPLKCLWCSNPESQLGEAELSHSESVCKRCGRCMETCELKAIVVDGTGVHIDRSLCSQCGRCVEACNYQAMKMLGQRMTVDEVFREVSKDKQYYDISGGGMTVSGGEPLFQSEFVAALLEKCRQNGIHTCIETCGFGSSVQLQEVLSECDLVLFDLKVTDEAAHQRLTGVSNKPIINNLDRVIETGKPLVVRVPVVPGYNTDAAYLADLAALLQQRRLNTVELMPYHKYGTGKYQMIGREYPLPDIAVPSDEELEAIKDALEASGIECEIVK